MRERRQPPCLKNGNQKKKAHRKMEGENMKVPRFKGAESKGQPAREKEGSKVVGGSRNGQAG